jgi:hypothetical protein
MCIIVITVGEAIRRVEAFTEYDPFQAGGADQSVIFKIGFDCSFVKRRRQSVPSIEGTRTFDVFRRHVTEPVRPAIPRPLHSGCDQRCRMFSNSNPATSTGRCHQPMHWQARRGYAIAKRLGFSVRALATAYGATWLGTDETVQAYFESAMLGAEAVALVRFRISDRTCTVAIPTIRTWDRSDRRLMSMSIAEASFASGRIVTVVSPRDVIREPRLSNATHIFRTMRPPAAGDAQAVRNRIAVCNGEASLMACEDALASPCARSRIFGLMAGGLLGIDLASPLGPESAIRLRPTDWAFDWDVLGWRAVRTR